MTTFLPRLALRLLVPALALGAIAALGEPIPAEAASESQLLVVGLHDAEFTDALQAEAEAAKKALHQSAAQMRWFVTLPATSKRCLSDSCSG